MEKEKNRMVIDIYFFEHLLNCMANQKYLNELESILLPEEVEENQKIIDDAWNAGMLLLSEARGEE